ncbi:hypothetical protein [Sphingomonas sp. Leaf62]|uniref:hypothetical protein n=1 Tax=Sphingomonas sp. Leaf62 TaxID=1736228 RepID=UPI0012E2D7C1|nr:hypothetical protein [Sphingomonas sp. Leaf62]
MPIDFSNDLHSAELSNAANILKEFARSHNMTMNSAIVIMMAAACNEGGPQTVYHLQKAANAFVDDRLNVNTPSRQQRRFIKRKNAKQRAQDNKFYGLEDSEQFRIFD